MTEPWWSYKNRPDVREAAPITAWRAGECSACGEAIACGDTVRSDAGHGWTCTACVRDARQTGKGQDT